MCSYWRVYHSQSAYSGDKRTWYCVWILWMWVETVVPPYELCLGFSCRLQTTADYIRSQFCIPTELLYRHDDHTGYVWPESIPFSLVRLILHMYLLALLLYGIKGTERLWLKFIDRSHDQAQSNLFVDCDHNLLTICLNNDLLVF